MDMQVKGLNRECQIQFSGLPQKTSRDKKNNYIEEKIINGYFNQ